MVTIAGLCLNCDSLYAKQNLIPVEGKGQNQSSTKIHNKYLFQRLYFLFNKPADNYVSFQLILQTFFSWQMGFTEI